MFQYNICACARHSLSRSPTICESLHTLLPSEYQHPYGPIQLPLKLQCQANALCQADDAPFADAASDMTENCPCLRSPLDIVAQSYSIGGQHTKSCKSGTGLGQVGSRRY